jgi:hypothetical protein
MQKLVILLECILQNQDYGYSPQKIMQKIMKDMLDMIGTMVMIILGIVIVI